MRRVLRYRCHLKRHERKAMLGLAAGEELVATMPCQRTVLVSVLGRWGIARDSTRDVPLGDGSGETLVRVSMDEFPVNGADGVTNKSSVADARELTEEDDACRRNRSAA